MLYTEKVMEAFQNPKNVGDMEDYDGMGQTGSEACGDIMQVFIKVENDRIVDAKFKTYGCAAAIASSSTATELIKGMTVEEALQVTKCTVLYLQKKRLRQLLKTISKKEIKSNIL